MDNFELAYTPNGFKFPCAICNLRFIPEVKCTDCKHNGYEIDDKWTHIMALMEEK